MLVANRTESEEEQAREDLGFQTDLGLGGDILSPEEAREVHGAVSREVRSWLWLPGESQVDAQRLAVALADAVQGAGVRLLRGKAVVAVRSHGSRVTGVTLDGGRAVEADLVIVAAGAWASGIRGLPRELPVRPVRGQMLRLLPSEPLPWTLVCTHDGRYLVPRVNGTVLVGSTMEDVGFVEQVTEAGRELLAEAAASLIPPLAESRIVESWAGLRPMSVDSWPILGPDPEMDGLFYAAGHGRNGVLFAPLVGRAVAELALRGVTEVDWEAFGIQRFETGR
jgi:glycine oxidase